MQEWLPFKSDGLNFITILTICITTILLVVITINIPDIPSPRTLAIAQIIDEISEQDAVTISYQDYTITIEKR